MVPSGRVTGAVRLAGVESMDGGCDTLVVGLVASQQIRDRAVMGRQGGAMQRHLVLLDGMALVYRAHFALIQRPIVTSRGVNTSALYGFTQTLLELRDSQGATHLAVAFDTAAPTRRHEEYPEYKAQREEMPEALVDALPQVRRMLEALRVPVLSLDGYEADDLIGTLVLRAEREGFRSLMVTPDKDFGQLVTERTRLYRPGRMGTKPEVMGPEEVCSRWGIERPEQVIDLLGLMGDASDNIPGVPGIGEKTAAKLIGQFGSVEGLLGRLGELKGKVRENLETHREQAVLSKHLATIDRDVPLEVDWADLEVKEPDLEALRGVLVEFEFNSLGRRFFGEDFKAGRGFVAEAGPSEVPVEERGGDSAVGGVVVPEVAVELRTRGDVKVDYVVVESESALRKLVERLRGVGVLGVAVGPESAVPRLARLSGVALSAGAGEAWWVPFPSGAAGRERFREVLRPLLEDEATEKCGHELKSDLAMLRGEGLGLAGRLFDVSLAHALVAPELRHSLAFMAESRLGYSPMAVAVASGGQGELGLGLEEDGLVGERAMERADLVLQLRGLLEVDLGDRGQERVFREMEMPLVPVLVGLEAEGVRVDAGALREFSEQLAGSMAAEERRIHELAGEEFNVNSPKQLGEVLFERMKLLSKPKKTRTGQYATDEQTLLMLAGDHEIVRRLLEYRTASKLRSTYAEALPAAIDSRTGRIHTTFQQLLTATGRLSSQNPNLQNIPIRTELGQEIRRAFVPRDEEHLLLSADYSQIELRIIAALSREAGLLEAFERGVDVHTATAARVFGVTEEGVTAEMRKKAKMVNYGIAYGISAFGLAQRLGIPRKEAASIIEHYFGQFAGIRAFMDRTIEGCRQRGYVETVTGRRRYLPEIDSRNATIRGAMERNAINAPIQGTAADMIKLAMVKIAGELGRCGLRTKMVLQVHDELLFDVVKSERGEVERLVEEAMRTALPLDVPIVVDVGVGRTWLEAH
ncbi:MAG: polymerase [Verrucomicrobiota bacterium]